MLGIGAALAAFAAGNALAAEKFEQWVEGLWPEAKALGISRETFERTMKAARLDRSLPDLSEPGAIPATGKRAQPEFVKPPGSYLSEKRLNDLARRGQQLAKQYATVLAGIEAKYGVPGSVVLAIWGRETDYGHWEHPHHVIDVLTTQAYLGRRRDYFRTELLWALKMLDDGDITFEEMRGSWAGAMGLTQFMPTNFRDFAVDFDGDGRRNIWTSIPDALASTAVSLVKAKDRETGEDYGWVPGRTWGYEVRMPASHDCSVSGLDTWKPTREWIAAGFERTHGRAFPPELMDEPAFLLIPEGTHGPVFLALKNFMVIKSYNFADLYALFVGHLADRIAGGKPFETPWGTDHPIRESDVLEIQQHLVGLGLDVGKVDGKAGWRTRVALGIFEKQHGLEVDCYPTADDLKMVRRLAGGQQ
jgi:lytic murein transglycosylase